MSYILDALKRADAERARGTVPGLHAQSVATASTAPRSSRNRLWLLLAGVVVLAAIAGAMARLRAPAAQERLSAAAPVRAERPVPMPLQAPTPPDTVPARPPRPDPAGAASAAVLPTPVAPRPPVRPAGEARIAVLAPPASSPASTPSPGAARKAGLTTPVPPVTTPAAKAPEERSSSAKAPLRSELPESVRREIPQLTITGAVDSTNPAQRLLLVNGQVLPQGGSPAAEVTILEIRAQSSLFSFRGTQFRVAH